MIFTPRKKLGKNLYHHTGQTHTKDFWRYKCLMIALSACWYASLLFCACVQLLLTYYQGLFSVLFKMIYHSIANVGSHSLLIILLYLYPCYRHSTGTLFSMASYAFILSLKLRVWATWCLTLITFIESWALRDFDLI